ncbi:protein-disulfide reductase DsbD domain-containing protein [Celeribacter indicus]|nr:protein-disulfide reductase DsbD domain-containing protein [Celeribacter indicus]SDW43110.1 Thiol-disulfide interchange protein, contains DsbC and DsbD domains [Celeribacter indicus]
MMKTLSLLFRSAALCLALTPPLAAQEGADLTRVEVLPGWQMENGHRMAALRVRLAPGWHTYWRAPGEAGIPPSFDWSGSRNVARVTPHWPAPALYDQNGMWYLGYEQELVLPLEITPSGPGELHLAGTMDLGVCNDICVPMRAEISAPLSASGDGGTSAPIRAALADRPERLSGARCEAAPIKDGMRLVATLALPDLGPREVAVIEHPDKAIWVSESALRRAGQTVEIASDLVPETAQPFFIDRSELTITVIGGGKAYEAQGCTGG